MTKYKSQAHLLAAGNVKLSSLGFSHLNIKTGIITKKSQLQKHQCYTPAILFIRTKGKLLFFVNITNSTLFHTRSKLIWKNLNYTVLPCQSPEFVPKRCFHVSTFLLKWPQENFRLSWTGLQALHSGTWQYKESSHEVTELSDIWKKSKSCSQEKSSLLLVLKATFKLSVHTYRSKICLWISFFPPMFLVFHITLKLSNALNNSCLFWKYMSAACATEGIGKTTYSSWSLWMGDEAEILLLEAHSCSYAAQGWLHCQISPSWVAQHHPWALHPS